MSTLATSIVSHGEVDNNAKETYGSGKTILRIGNGGAGATGLIKVLAEDYLVTRGKKGSIAWVCNHSRNTQIALLQDYIDLGLTYERDQEALAESEGWSRTAGCIFHDHFCLVGPLSDPAGLAASQSLEDAFAIIASTQAPFHSRADFSATMFKERSIWDSQGYQPWTDKRAMWYQTSLLSPQDALREADTAGAYCLTDRSTLLCLTGLRLIHNTTVFYEPTGKDHTLMNSCYAIRAATESAPKSEEVSLFLRYLLSPRGQGVIRAYGLEGPGLPLFAPVADGFSRDRMKGGKPVRGLWVMRSTENKL